MLQAACELVHLRIQNLQGKLKGLNDCKSITREKPVLFPPLRIGAGGHQQSLLSRQLRTDSCSQFLPWACKRKANGFATYQVPVSISTSSDQIQLLYPHLGSDGLFIDLSFLDRHERKNLSMQCHWPKLLMQHRSVHQFKVC